MQEEKKILLKCRNYTDNKSNADNKINEKEIIIEFDEENLSSSELAIVDKEK